MLITLMFSVVPMKSRTSSKSSLGEEFKLFRKFGLILEFREIQDFLGSVIALQGLCELVIGW